MAIELGFLSGYATTGEVHDPSLISSIDNLSNSGVYWNICRELELNNDRL